MAKELSDFLKTDYQYGKIKIVLETSINVCSEVRSNIINVIL